MWQEHSNSWIQVSMLLLPIAILSKAQGTNIDNDAQLQSNEHPGSINVYTPPHSYQHSVALEALTLVGVLDAPSAMMCERQDTVF